jgi:hypothetical protein
MASLAIPLASLAISLPDNGIAFLIGRTRPLTGEPPLRLQPMVEVAAVL